MEQENTLKWNNGLKTRSGYFWCGYLICIAVKSLEQDFTGKERWLKLASERWVDEKYTIPLAIAIIITVVIYLVIIPEEK